jgi:hypothetical protein
VERDPQTAVTPLGQLLFFIEFLKTADLCATCLRDCPLRYQSPNAPKPSICSGPYCSRFCRGHHRYVHITTIRTDGVDPALLGVSKVCNEDSVRQALGALDETASTSWLQTHLLHCDEPLLTEPWIVDVNVTEKPLDSHQEGRDRL